MRLSCALFAFLALLATALASIDEIREPLVDVSLDAQELSDRLSDNVSMDEDAIKGIQETFVGMMWDYNRATKEAKANKDSFTADNARLFAYYVEATADDLESFSTSLIKLKGQIQSFNMLDSTREGVSDTQKSAKAWSDALIAILQSDYDRTYFQQQFDRANDSFQQIVDQFAS